MSGAALAEEAKKEEDARPVPELCEALESVQATVHLAAARVIQRLLSNGARGHVRARIVTRGLSVGCVASLGSVVRAA